MLLSKYVETVVNQRTAKYYLLRGYVLPTRVGTNGKIIPDYGKPLRVEAKDLMKNSVVIVDVSCDCCGKKYKIQYNTYSEINHDGLIYCHNCSPSVLCSGENSPRWKNDKTSTERENQRCYPEYTQFIRNVIDRDNYTCVHCGKRSNGDIQVHHLDGYNWCIDRRTDVTNAVTLCENCHKNFHMIYGKGNNTKKQFDVWMNDITYSTSNNNVKLPTARKIFCIEENKIYSSASYLAKMWSIEDYQINIACNWKNHLCDEHRRISVKGKHLLWLDEYENMTVSDWEQYNNFIVYKHAKKVICINTLDIYDSVRKACDAYNIKNGYSIIGVCKGIYKSAGKLQDGSKLKWMYYEDYLKLAS